MIGEKNVALRRQEQQQKQLELIVQDEKIRLIVAAEEVHPADALEGQRDFRQVAELAPDLERLLHHRPRARRLDAQHQCVSYQGARSDAEQAARSDRDLPLDRLEADRPGVVPRVQERGEPLFEQARVI